MHETINIDALNDERLVYIRAVDVADLPDDMQDEVDQDEQLYAVHAAADGERLAIVKDRKLAFELAIENDYAPVTVH